ncbi:MAG: MerR family transcriptional regulator [Clostridiales bacterium]|nr:MerR family transcriptional regulator [Clostridiales bacterium]
MISIGQFSKICSVSLKTLRHYDKIELLKPFKVDKFTGYRYYDESQLNRMLTISRLKRYGFSLTEIKSFLDSSEDKGALLSMLQSRAGEIIAEIRHKEMLIKELSGIIKNFERTGEIMSYQSNYEVSIIESEKIFVLSSRQRMAVEEFGKYYGKLFEKTAAENIKPTGIVLAVYHDEEWNERDSDIEVGIGVDDESKANNSVGGCLCATTVHKGSYANLPEAYASVLKWINNNGYEIASPPYEIYRNSGMDGIPVEDWRTDIYFPVKNK